MNVMIVDDEQDVQLLFKQQFRREIKSNQIQLYFASSAEKALEYLQNSKCLGLILADINMPEMNGLELLDNLKEKIWNIFTEELH
jgi:CheY-like chemotaxis protein